ncbi:ribonuclease H-like protein [Armillaria luteobubalina]|uniref:ribonuclease H n=1 Tax=Armillaria luteobubalina TaxID=153913 RepID=A0AA39Q553_9AGAR|nr:ribonuclease H-like protein [Armillaria luteobubalina]
MGPEGRPVTISIAYTDGSTYDNSTANACARAGVWFGDGDERNIHVQLPGPYQMNNMLEELVRAWFSIQVTINDEAITTISDSKYVIEGLCFHLKHWESNGWIGVSNRDIWKATAAALRKRGTPVFFQWTKGHNGDKGNEGADTLAEKGALLDASEATPANIEINQEFTVEGARLSEISQSQAYRHIQQKKGKLHIGAFWDCLSPQYAQRGECPGCKVPETMEHILTECEITGQSMLWSLARELWEMKGLEWIPPTYGVALGASLLQIRGENGKVSPSATRLYRILATETLHLIWKIRCQRRIQQGDDDPTKWHSEEQVWNLWIEAMNKRLTIDRLLVNKLRYGSKAMTKTKVLSTWRGTLHDEKSLPEDWISQRGVLVGIVPLR